MNIVRSHYDILRLYPNFKLINCNELNENNIEISKIIFDFVKEIFRQFDLYITCDFQNEKPLIIIEQNFKNPNIKNFIQSEITKFLPEKDSVDVLFKFNLIDNMGS